MWCPEHLVAVVADIVKIKVPEDYVRRLWCLANFAIMCVGLGLLFMGIALPLVQELYLKTSYEYLGYNLNIPRMLLCLGMAGAGLFFIAVAAFGFNAILADKINSIIAYGRFVFAISILKIGGAICVLGGIAFGLAIYFFFTSPAQIKYSVEVLLSYFAMICAIAVMVFAGIELAASIMALYVSILIKERSPAR